MGTRYRRDYRATKQEQSKLWREMPETKKPTDEVGSFYSDVSERNHDKHHPN